MCIPLVCLVPTERRGGQETSELKLQMVVNCHINTRNRILVSGSSYCSYYSWPLLYRFIVFRTPWKEILCRTLENTQPLLDQLYMLSHISCESVFIWIVKMYSFPKETSVLTLKSLQCHGAMPILWIFEIRSTSGCQRAHSYPLTTYHVLSSNLCIWAREVGISGTELQNQPVFINQYTCLKYLVTIRLLDETKEQLKP